MRKMTTEEMRETKAGAYVYSYYGFYIKNNRWKFGRIDVYKTPKRNGGYYNYKVYN